MQKYMLQSISELFSLCYVSSCFPYCWNVTNVTNVLIFKSYDGVLMVTNVVPLVASNLLAKPLEYNIKKSFVVGFESLEHLVCVHYSFRKCPFIIYILIAIIEGIC